jgi:hypothetical protein
MGSDDAFAALPQQPLEAQHSAGSSSPERTRRAAAPYFSFTTAERLSGCCADEFDMWLLNYQEMLIGKGQERPR